VIEDQVEVQLHPPQIKTADTVAQFCDLNTQISNLEKQIEETNLLLKKELQKAQTKKYEGDKRGARIHTKNVEYYKVHIEDLRLLILRLQPNPQPQESMSEYYRNNQFEEQSQKMLVEAPPSEPEPQSIIPAAAASLDPPVAPIESIYVENTTIEDAVELVVEQDNPESHRIKITL
jgi:hypothetical protein